MTLFYLLVLAIVAVSAFLIGKRIVTAKVLRQQHTDKQPLGRQHMDMAAPYQLVKARYGWLLANPNDLYLGRAIIEYGEYSELESRFLADLPNIRPGTVVEVGANAGLLTIPLAQALAAAGREMIAIEPQPFLFQNLCANLALNGLSNVRAWPWACGSEQATLYFPRQNYAALGNFGGVEMVDASSSASVAVPCMLLDDVVGTTTVSLIKIDVEGAELEVLKGASALIAASRPVLYMENDRLDKSQALIEWLMAHNYRLWWHLTPLFNADNFFGTLVNLYDDAHSLNMLCLPREFEMPDIPLTEITDATSHPFSVAEKTS